MRIRPLPTLVVALLCGCGTNAAQSSSSADGGFDGGLIVDAGTPDGGGKDAGFICPPPTKHGGGEQTIVPGAVTAKLVDETGAPVEAGQPLYICGINLCTPPKSVTADGSATISTTFSVKKPAFKFGDAVDYAEFGIPLTTSPTDFRSQGTGLLATARLAGKPSALLTPGGDATSGDVTVSLVADTTVTVDELIYDTPQKAAFRAVQIPLTNAGPLLPTEPSDFALLYGIGPAETTFCPAAKITVKIPDTLGWAPGAAVEFWVTTIDVVQSYAPYAGWALMSEGAVSEDGKTVVTADGQGFSALEHFAIRLKQ